MCPYDAVNQETEHLFRRDRSRTTVVIIVAEGPQGDQVVSDFVTPTSYGLNSEYDDCIELDRS